MNFRFSPEEEEFHREVCQFFDKELTDEILQEHEERGLPGVFYYRQLCPKMAARGWLGLAFPGEYGGQGSIWKQFILVEELAYRGVYFRNLGVSILGPSLLIFGTEEQKREFIPKIVRGEITFCALLSEPDAGSDSANIQTRAQEQGDHYLINGQKVWASEADLVDWGMITVRTDPSAPKHRGISMFLLPMKSKGVEIRPLVSMVGDRRFNEVFLTDVSVPKRYLVGEKNRGWYQLMTFFEFERGSFLPAELVGTMRRVLDDLKEQYERTNFKRNEHMRQMLAQVAVELEVLKMLAFRPAWIWSEGRHPTYEAHMVKVFGSELTQRSAQVTLQVLGLYGQLDRGSIRAPLNGKAPRHYLRTISDTIRGGTSEIQRNIIAIRGLGLQG